MRVNYYIYNAFKSLGKGEADPLIEEDIPRTFPHLNELFEEIQSLATSL
jgi:hypothetical protein